jgi:hypothetical protein
MNKIENNIDDMTNLQIKENIISLNQKQLKSIKNASYLNVFNSIITLKEILEEKETLDDSRFNGELDNFYKYIDKFIKTTTKSFNLIGSTEKIDLEDINTIRQELYDSLAIAEGYLIELSYVGEFVDQHGIKVLAKTNYSNTAYEGKKIDELLVMINHILTESKNDYNKYIYIISEIIGILPMRLVKDNYYNIIKDTITRNFKSYNKIQIENQINDYKKQFDSSTRDGYGTRFDYYFREIQKLRRIDLKDTSLDDLSDIVNEIIRVTKEINELLDFILRLGLVSNMNMVIELTKEIDISLEMENIFEQWNQVLKNRDKDEIKDFRIKMEKEIDNIEGDIFKDLDEFETLNTEILKREDFDVDELNEELIYTQKVLTYYNDSKLSDYSLINSIDNQIPINEYLEQSVESLIQYINRAIPKMNNIERKTRMRKLLSIIELPFSGMEDFLNYIKYSLDNRIIPTEEINFIIDHILYFLNELVKQK